MKKTPPLPLKNSVWLETGFGSVRGMEKLFGNIIEGEMGSVEVTTIFQRWWAVGLGLEVSDSIHQIGGWRRGIKGTWNNLYILLADVNFQVARTRKMK